MTVEAGSKAPAFELAGDDGQTISLAGLKGRKVVLYFYPKDDTPGCTKEAIEFTALVPEFEAAGATVVGVSKESAASKAKFRKKHSLGVKLGADESGVIEA
ncbi:MAG: peroxiredoxin, partial [Alphaproteobacteria bacterium]|nr:peroxiredoxin [Alphaproteobacteria bacterium]